MHKLGRLATIVLATVTPIAVMLLAVAQSPMPASAADCTSTAYLGPDGNWIPAAGCPGSPGGSAGGGAGSGGGASACDFYDLAQAAQVFGWGGASNPAPTPPFPAPSGQVWLVEYCPGAIFYGFSLVLFVDGGHLTTQILAQRAYSTLSPPDLQVGTAPLSPSGTRGTGVVGVPEWFWIRPASYRTISATASLAGLSATVTANPGPLVVTPGDGQPSFDCKGPGARYDIGKPASAQQSGCTHLYTAPSSGQPGNVYVVSVSVTWIATWTGTPTGGGTLPPITTTTTISLPIAQAESLFSGD